MTATDVRHVAPGAGDAVALEEVGVELLLHRRVLVGRADAQDVPAVDRDARVNAQRSLNCFVRDKTTDPQ